MLLKGHRFGGVQRSLGMFLELTLRLARADP